MFWLSRYGHVKSECPTFLRSKGKAMVVTLSDDEVYDHESGSDDDGNFITFTATAIFDESVVVDENPSDRELFRVLICKKLIISFKGYCKGCNEC